MAFRKGMRLLASGVAFLTAVFAQKPWREYPAFEYNDFPIPPDYRPEYWRGILDDKGRIMVAICHNMDWEIPGSMPTTPNTRRSIPLWGSASASILWSTP